MKKIYSRSYGSIETDGKTVLDRKPAEGAASEKKGSEKTATERAPERTLSDIHVPPDYHGSMYTGNRQHEPEPAPPVKETNNLPVHAKPISEPPPSKQTGLLGGLLEKISVEDLIMFGLILAMLFGDSDDNTALLAVILAIILT